jgi:RNA polymerase sigma-70 factor (ECF subfamily)
MQRHFEEALQKVSEQQRQVLWLREMRGYSYPEIATLLRIPEGTVKSALHRGRQRAMAAMEERGQQP